MDQMSKAQAGKGAQGQTFGSGYLPAVKSQGQILAVCILTAKIPNSDSNLAVDFSSRFSKEKGPQNPRKNPPQKNHPEIRLEKAEALSRQKVWYAPRNPGKTNFLVAYPQKIARISRVVPEKFENKKFVLRITISTGREDTGRGWRAGGVVGGGGGGGGGEVRRP